MFRLLIVEDERTAREAIRDTIDWKQWGFSEIRDAANGEEGLAISHSYKPHLIITDILMPKMDGLEFSKHVHLADSHCRIIVLSAYQNPDFVHSAFQSRAVDYLLKPIKEDELIEAVGRAVRELLLRINQAHDVDLDSVAGHGSINGVREQVLCLFLGNNPHVNELWQSYHHFFETSDNTPLQFGLINITLAPDGDEERADELENRLNEYSDDSPVSSFDLAQPIRIKYNELVYVLGIDPNRHNKHGLLSAVEKEILQITTGLEIPNVTVIRTGWASNLIKIGDLHRSTADQSTEDGSNHLHVNHASSREKDLATEVMEIIDQRFVDDNISVKEIAHELSMSSAYLCMTFKKAYGLTINEYLNLCRVKEAKHLLVASDLKLYDIAYESGFSSANYLAKVFRKYENCTPTEYKENNR